MIRIFTAVGGIVAATLALRFFYFWLRIFYLYVIPRNQRKRLRAYGEWAIVTGCTDGIGREYALQLAENGMSVVLISRSQDKLHTVAEEIATRYSGVKTMTVAVDFTRLDVYETIEKAIADIDIGILVNNVGMGNFDFANPKLADKPRSAHVDTVVCNCISQTAMSKIVLPKMAANRRGLIVDVSSGTSITPMPFYAVYGATKRYVTYLSSAIRMEYAEFGVEVQTCTPFFVATNLSGIRRTSFFVKSPQSYVRSHLNTFGVASRVHGCIAHEIEAALLNNVLKIVPTWLRESLALRAQKSTVRAALAAQKRRAEAAAAKKQN